MNGAFGRSAAGNLSFSFIEAVPGDVPKAVGPEVGN
jgi:hypothetical protein